MLIGETEQNPAVLLGLRSRTALCNPDNTVNCNLEPERCTECSVILQANVDDATKTATVDSLEDIKVHNLPVSNFSGFSDFVSGTAVNGVNYGVLPTFASLPSEMTIVASKTLRVDLADNELILQQNGGQAMPIAGGLNAPGVVDLQLVFNLQDANGRVTKVGVPLAANNGMYRLCGHGFERQGTGHKVGRNIHSGQIQNKAAEDAGRSVHADAARDRRCAGEDRRFAVHYDERARGRVHIPHPIDDGIYEKSFEGGVRLRQ